MSYVDLETKKIVGAEEGSISWFHEMGHLEFAESEQGIKNSFRQTFYLYVAVTCVIMGQFSILFAYSSLVFIALFWFYYLYEEFWCWIYAFRRRKELKGGGENVWKQKRRIRSE